jgi:hypothetical protein
MDLPPVHCWYGARNLQWSTAIASARAAGWFDIAACPLFVNPVDDDRTPFSAEQFEQRLLAADRDAASQIASWLSNHPRVKALNDFVATNVGASRAMAISTVPPRVTVTFSLPRRARPAGPLSQQASSSRQPAKAPTSGPKLAIKRGRAAREAEERAVKPVWPTAYVVVSGDVLAAALGLDNDALDDMLGLCSSLRHGCGYVWDVLALSSAGAVYTYLPAMSEAIMNRFAGMAPLSDAALAGRRQDDSRDLMLRKRPPGSWLLLDSEPLLAAVDDAVPERTHAYVPPISAEQAAALDKSVGDAPAAAASPQTAVTEIHVTCRGGFVETLFGMVANAAASGVAVK